MHHISVLAEEVLRELRPKKGDTALDLTLGLGGHARMFADAIGPTGHLIAFDADTDNIALAKAALEGSSCANRDIYHANFSSIEEYDLPPCDIVFADLGLSSPHLDDPSRGFSFRFEGPLDLRLDRTQGKTAAEHIEQWEEEEIAQHMRQYGELFKEAKKLARVIKTELPASTTHLKSVVEDAYGFRAKGMLPQVFQALRIAVNNELSALEVMLRVAPTLLKPGGRLGVISFHSLEDRMVKHVFRNLTTAEKDPITGQPVIVPPFELPFRKAIVPTDAEAKENPRSRSAKFRVLQKKIV